MFVILKNGNHAEISKTEAERIALQVSSDERTMIKACLAERYGKEVAGCTDLVSAVLEYYHDALVEGSPEEALKDAVECVNVVAFMSR